MSNATVFINAKIATISQNRETCGVDEADSVVIEGGMIAWVGPLETLPAKFINSKRIDLDGGLLTPGLIDCHTHVVFGGNRSTEFELRLNGASYEEVAKAGGGIVSTVKATRAATLDQLVEGALPRIDAMISEGVTTVEVKSGYGLDTQTELNMLRAARRIETERPIRVRTSFLGAHAVPAEFSSDPDRYIDEICIPTLKAANAEGLVDAVDGFCEMIAFSAQQIERVFEVADELGLPVKLHAEQLSHQGGTKLATKHSALSVDHVEYATESDAEAMAASNSVAVLLPGAFYTLRETQLPPIEAFRKHGVPMALATDCNPGSSPLTSILLIMNMGCTLFHLTPQESLSGVTRSAAAALGLEDCGEIKTGMRADLAVWDVEKPAELSYRIGFNSLKMRIYGGKIERR